MKRISVLVVALAAALVMAVGSGSAVADHNQRSCEAEGGTWTSDQGFKTCTFVTEEEGKNDNFQCTTTDPLSGRGNLGNKTEDPPATEEEENTGSGKCPPGQYPN